MQTPDAPTIVFGFPEEWEPFRQRHAPFFEKYDRLLNAAKLAFDRPVGGEPIEQFVILYGQLCFEDFNEILLCCGNGYGAAATKLLRTLFERAVTLEYLNRHPDELQSFYDWERVRQDKLYKSIAETLGPDAIPSEIRKNAAAESERVREQFQITACEKCGTKRLNHTWKLDIVSMAKSTRILKYLISSSYYMPLRDAHATAASLIDRLKEDEGELYFDRGPQHAKSDNALRRAHQIILEVLDQQRKRFTVDGLPNLLDQCVHDCMEINGVDEAGNRIGPRPQS